MNTIKTLFQKISYDIYCPLDTIAEQIYTNISESDRILAMGGKGGHRYNPSISGKTVSFISCYSSLCNNSECEREYNWALEALGKLFRTDVNSEDYPVSHIRVHIQYLHPGMAEFVYNGIMRENLQETFKTICIENISDITMEDNNTIGVTYKTFRETDKLWVIFIGYENQFRDQLTADERTKKLIQEYNNQGSLERSTHSLITSICVMIMIMELITRCCT